MYAPMHSVICRTIERILYMIGAPYKIYTVHCARCEPNDSNAPCRKNNNLKNNANLTQFQNLIREKGNVQRNKVFTSTFSHGGGIVGR
jgi:hypothetical protein